MSIVNGTQLIHVATESCCIARMQGVINATCHVIGHIWTHLIFQTWRPRQVLSLTHNGLLHISHNPPSNSFLTAVFSQLFRQTNSTKISLSLSAMAQAAKVPTESVANSVSSTHFQIIQGELTCAFQIVTCNSRRMGLVWMGILLSKGSMLWTTRLVIPFWLCPARKTRLWNRVHSEG